MRARTHNINTYIHTHTPHKHTHTEKDSHTLTPPLTRLGRRKSCLLYCVLYIASCATKHGQNYWVLMLGRILGGVATSLLFSSFESWMVCECGRPQLSSRPEP